MGDSVSNIMKAGKLNSKMADAEKQVKSQKKRKVNEHSKSKEKSHRKVKKSKNRA